MRSERQFGPSRYFYKVAPHGSAEVSIMARGTLLLKSVDKRLANYMALIGLCGDFEDDILSDSCTC